MKIYQAHSISLTRVDLNTFLYSSETKMRGDDDVEYIKHFSLLTRREDARGGSKKKRAKRMLQMPRAKFRFEMQCCIWGIAVQEWEVRMRERELRRRFSMEFKSFAGMFLSSAQFWSSPLWYALHLALPKLVEPVRIYCRGRERVFGKMLRLTTKPFILTCHWTLPTHSCWLLKLSTLSWTHQKCSTWAITLFYRSLCAATAAFVCFSVPHDFSSEKYYF